MGIPRRAIALLSASLATTAMGATLHPEPLPPEEPLGMKPIEAETPLAVVRHRWQVKIAESNQVAIRPGSVYDIVTYFEQNGGIPRPGFNYMFLDLGLGAADPLYPIFQRGHQKSWSQLLPAMWSRSNRHIDHTSVIDTPEGCRVHSTYWVRHIDEFPDRFAEERAAGYTLVDISFNYYERLEPDAQCGRHASHAPDPDFRPRAYIQQFADSFRGLDQIPPAMLARYEAKIGLLKLVSEEFDRSRWPRFREVYRFEKNSLWYYPKGVPKHYRLDTPRPQGVGLPALTPDRLVYPAGARLRKRFRLDRVLGAAIIERIAAFLDGHPVPAFDPEQEPGRDTLALDQITAKQFFTAGLRRRPIGPASRLRKRLLDPRSYRLVGVVAHPYEPQSDQRWQGTRIVPQLRLVYQLQLPFAPGEPPEPVEQLYLHVKFDALDGTAPAPDRDKAHRAFLSDVARTGSRPERLGSALSAWEERVARLVETHRQHRPRAVSFSSALTGIWVFGSLSRDASPDGPLAPLRIRRAGIDVGYYSSVYDTVLFRKAAAEAHGARRQALLAQLDALTPRRYRDPRRSDPHAIRSARMTCAQCHQMAGRDAVHVALNDGLDRRFTEPVRASEFLYRELDRQLRGAPGYWNARGGDRPAISGTSE